MPISPRTIKLDSRIAGAALMAATIALYSVAFLVESPAASLCGLVSLVPMLAFAERFGPRRSALAGALTGGTVLGLVCRWLATYHAGALYIAMILGAAWFAAAFAAASALLRTRSRFAIPAAAFVWAGAELGRSFGFLAFPYASLPYSLADSVAALSLASLGGVPLVGLFVAGANASIYAALRRPRGPCAGRLAGGLLRGAFGAGCALALVALGTAGERAPIGLDARPIAAAPDTAPEPGRYRVALIQPSVRSQKSVVEYRSAFERLSSLSDAALAMEPDLVAWHETAIVPPIGWHLRYRPDRPTYAYIADVDAYLRAFPVPVLVGSGYADPEDPHRSVEHNSAILFVGGKAVDRYDKVNLVPFSEFLPRWARAEGLTRWIVARFGEFWTPGSGPRILASGEARFAAPICFEDSFGRYLASFDAPDFFIVLTNDAWAGSAAMQRQHLAMSRFRAAETASIVLRVADTGSTVAIDPEGSVALELPPFEGGSLVVDVPLGAARTTVYEAAGKHCDIAILCIGLALAALCAGPRRPSFRIDKNRAV